MPADRADEFSQILTLVFAGQMIDPDADEPVASTTPATVGAAARPAILVAEDNPANQKVASAMLAKLGYRMDVVANGAEALEALERIAYGAVLMDCQMPVMDGYAATAAIRQREAGAAHLPIIAMTAAAMEGDEDRCLAAGMDDYVTKPVLLDDLSSVLKRWVPSGQRATARLPVSHPVSDLFDDKVITSVRELLSGEPGGLAAFLARFLESTGASLTIARTSLAAGDTTTAERELHSIVGGAAVIGAQRLSNACRRIEQRLREGTEPVSPAVLDAIDDEVRHLETWLRREGDAPA